MSSEKTLPPYKNKNLEDIKGEVWKDIPGLEGYGMISNCGRVKKLAHEAFNKNGRLLKYEDRIQSQKMITYFNRFTQDTAGHLSARIQVNGVCHAISVGRIVYYCFVETFDLSDHSIFVSYKDYDRLNTSPDNLFKTDISGIQHHIMSAGRKDLHFGHSAENQAVFSEMGRRLIRKKVSQYDMQGNYIATYPSISAGAKATGIQLAGISAAASDRALTAGGYIWRHGSNKNRVTPRAVKKIHTAIRATRGNPVSRYDLDGKKVKTYYNIMQAAKELGVSRERVRDAVHGKLIVLENAVWRKGDADTVNVDRERRSLELRKGYTLSKYTPEGKKIVTYRSSKEAAANEGIQQEQINAMATREDLLLRGFIWRYGDAPSLSEAEVERIRENLLLEKRRDITQYDLMGKRLGYFSSVMDASRKTGVIAASIQGSIDGRKVTGGGFIWRRGKGRPRLKIPETPRPFGNQLRVKIAQYTKEGAFVASYPTIAEASRQTGINKTIISSATRKGDAIAGGYVWKRQ